MVVYWIVQAAVAYVLWPVLLDDSLDVLKDAGFVAFVGAMLAFIMVGQAVLVMPVRPPGAGPGSRIGRWGRCLLAGVTVGLLASAAVWTVMWAMMLVRADWLPDEVQWALVVGVPGAAWIGTTLFLLWKSRDGMPAGLSLIVTALGAAALVAGFAAGAMGAAQLAFKADFSDRTWAAATSGTLILSWVVATPLLLAFGRRVGHETALGWISSRLFLGSVIEAALVIPVDAMTRRKTSCYCGEGTLWSLMMCWAVGTLVLGPAIWLLPIGRRRRRWLQGRCEACGYDMRGCPGAERCPECGAGWKPATRAA